MSDKYKNYTSGLRDPIQSAENVTPDDVTDLADVSRALYIGTGGDVRVTLLSGNTHTFKAASAGWHPIRVTRIWATETTATDIIACS